MQDTTDKEKQSCKKIFYIDFGCHTHIVNDALTFCTILTKFDFFIKNRRF